MCTNSSSVIWRHVDSLLELVSAVSLDSHCFVLRLGHANDL